ncbi:MAG TPA: serine hydrolase, partial [Polyangiaceae bacterium]
RLGLATDYLDTLGGEANAVLAAGTELALKGGPGGVLRAREAKPNDASIVDLAALFGEGTDMKIAYAYAELESAEATKALALFGSDDGAAVWLNGRQVHRVESDRPVDPGSDRFDVELSRGKNRLLVKIDNSYGGWAFALRLFDETGRQRLEAIDRRRHLERLEVGPNSGDHLLGSSFPEVVWRDARAAALVFGDAPLEVRWFGPDLVEVERPEKDGRYVVLVQAKTLDGYTHRRMLSFAKVPAQTLPWFPAPPYSEGVAPVTLPSDLSLNEGQRAELSRHLWAAGFEAMWHGQNGALLAATLHELAEARPVTGDPAWLSGSFVRNAEHQLRVRLALEGRKPKALAPPEKLQKPAPVLRAGSEAQAKMKPGTVVALRKLAREWAADDPHGFVVLVARRGVVFMHEGFNGFDKDAHFRPASIGKTVAGLTVGRAVDQGLVSLDQQLGTMLPDWQAERTAKVTLRHCFYHVTGLRGHFGHGGLYNAYLDNDLMIQDAAFAEPLKAFIYGGNAVDLAGKALELVTGQSIFRLLYENLQKPFGEDVTQFDLGVGDRFTALYLAKIGQMFVNDGAYGEHRLFKPGFLRALWPKRIADYVPGFEDEAAESGVGLSFMVDPPGPRQRGALGPNVLGHGSGSGVAWRIAPEHELVIVVGRNGFEAWQKNEEWSSRFVQAVAESLPESVHPQTLHQ